MADAGLNPVCVLVCVLVCAYFCVRQWLQKVDRQRVCSRVSSTLVCSNVQVNTRIWVVRLGACGCGDVGVSLFVCAY